MHYSSPNADRPGPEHHDRGARLRAQDVPCFNVIFHSSEVLPGGSPYTPDERSVERFLSDLQALLEHLTSRLGAVGRTCAEFARERAPAA